MARKDNQREEVVCEFFGIQVTTRNPNIAKTLKTDVKELMARDIQHLGHRRPAATKTSKEVVNQTPGALDLLLVP